MRIIQKKGGECPICRRQIKPPNVWVRFHVRYGPHPIVILACKNCNWVEMLLRTKRYDSSIFPDRAQRVISYMKKYSVDLSIG